MKNRVMRFAAAGVLALTMGILLTACNSPSTFAAGAQNQPAALTTPNNLQPVMYDDRVPATIPVRRVVHRSASTYGYQDGTTVQRRHRTWERSAVIIGASSGTGAVIGALAHGKKGAAIGALAGGAAGLIYDRMTANK